MDMLKQARKSHSAAYRSGTCRMQNEELLLKTCARYIDSIKPNDKVLEGNLPKRCSQQP
eukprot:CAMPEP_0174738128 /NCGR_PEP_ID=MMETSP1094-20130205/69433_1 /TAXON_ID=156173 /ORGANISM="Chrysochromulina brevifilum, Strain UTEX LB 985" /LENGTH=58 /DNA_ID=CAMNT_0015941479 /DNA_START=88 /DNA_END=261 /DNA_ORIENTATION=-